MKTKNEHLIKDQLVRRGAEEFQWPVDGTASFAVKKGEVVVMDGGNYAVWESLPAQQDCVVTVEQVSTTTSLRWTLSMPASMVEDTLEGHLATDIGGWNIWVGHRPEGMKFGDFFAGARMIEHLANGYGDGSFPCHTQVNGEVGSLHMNQCRPDNYRDVATRALDAWFAEHAQPGRIAGTLEVDKLPADLIAATWHTKPGPSTGYIGWPYRQNYLKPNKWQPARDHYFIDLEAAPVFYDSLFEMKGQLLPVNYWTWWRPDGTKVPVVERVSAAQLDQLKKEMLELPLMDVPQLPHYVTRGYHGGWREGAVKRARFLVLHRDYAGNA